MFKNFVPVVEHSLKYNKSLDGLRGVAISLVLLFHIYPKYFSFGYVGVDVFFILSGYLITKIIYTKLESNLFSFAEFYRNRVRRIFPAMIIVVFSSFILGYIFLFPYEFLELLRNLKSSLFFYQNLRLISEIGYWDIEAQLKPMVHFWSLSIEEQFYLLWPLLVWCMYRLKIDIFKGLLIVSLCFMIFPQFLEIDKFYHSLARFWELSLGGLVFSIEYKKAFNRYVEKIAPFSMYLFVIAILFSLHNVEFNFLKTFIITVTTGFLVLSLSKKGIHHKVLSSSILVFLGLISYPLYLWHYILISYLNILKFSQNEVALFGIFMSILLSYLTYRYVEYYARRQKSYKIALALFLFVLISGLSLQGLRLHSDITKRAHLDINEAYEKQFERMDPQNIDGIALIQNVLGHKPQSEYILSTSKDTSKEYIAIIGDSHAYAAYYGFSRISQDAGYETVLFANSSCPPYIGGAMGENEKKLERCQYKIDEIYSFLDKATFVKKIIFITRGTVYETDKGFGLADGGDIPRGYKYTSYFTNSKNYQHKEEFYKAVDKTFDYLQKKTNIDVYYLFENPELGFSPRDYMDRPFVKVDNQFKNKLSFTSYEKRQLEYRKNIEKIHSHYPYIQLLDNRVIFCDRDFCYSIIGDKMLYSDDDHLSMEGSLLQAMALKSQIFN